MSGLLEKARSLGKAYADGRRKGGSPSLHRQLTQLEAELLEEVVQAVARSLPEDASPIEIVPPSKSSEAYPLSLPRIYLGRRNAPAPGESPARVIMGSNDDLGPLSLSSTEVLAGVSVSQHRPLGAVVPILEHLRDELVAHAGGTAAPAIAQVEAVLDAIREADPPLGSPAKK